MSILFDEDRSSRYFNFLCSLVKTDTEYKYLFNWLHSTEFYSLVPNDDNRCEDGKKLRNMYLDMEARVKCRLVKGENFGSENSSVFEMLIGLAYRMENSLVGSNFEKSLAECFEIFLFNLGLSWYSDSEIEEYNPSFWDGEIERRLKIFLERKYMSDGQGGLFPLRNPKSDQRKVEIWYQMSEYLLENYEF